MAEVAFVTGASGGIGRAVVQRLRARGDFVVATDRVIAQLPCGDAGLSTRSVDVTDEYAVQKAVESAVATHGRIDHVVHLAGEAGAGPLEAVSREEWLRLLDVNLTSAFLLAKAVHAPLRASRGSLTLMSSTNALNGGSQLSGPAYAVAKAGVLNLMRYLAKEWASDAIRVNAVAPGPIDTPMVARFPAAVRAQIAGTVPLKRLGEAAEVAGAIAYLTGPDGRFLTGVVHNVSGGLVLD